MTVGQLRMLEGVIEGVDGSGRDSGGLEEVQPFRPRPGGHRPAERVGVLLGMLLDAQRYVLLLLRARPVLIVGVVLARRNYTLIDGSMML